MTALRRFLFWTHLLAGLTAGSIIFIMCATGVILMYEPQISELSERDARRVDMPTNGRHLSYDELLSNLRQAMPQARPAMMVVKSDPSASVMINLGRETVFIDPYNGKILGGFSATHDFLRSVVDWHRWLGTEGEGRATARTITGACNLAFFWLAISGFYLWWPRTWQWRGLKMSLLFIRPLRGKARDWNWHNVIGFWSSAVLVILTLTAAVMSYPWANDLLYTLTGSEPPPRTQNAGPAAPNPRRSRASNDGETRAAKPAVSVDALWTRAERQVAGWVMIMLRFPPSSDGPVIASIQGPDAFHSFQRSQLTLNRATGEIMKWEPYGSNSTGRKLRTWVRALHTGEAFGFAGQTVAGLASLGGCFLVWTGVAMAWRRFRSWRRTPKEIISEESVMNLGVDQINFLEQHQPEPNPVDTELAHSLRETNTSVANGHFRALQDLARERAAASTDGESVLILYGTMTGNSEALAKKFAGTVQGAGFTAVVRDMADYHPDTLVQARCVLLVASTYGDGEPPDDAAPFCEAIVRGNGLDLRGVKYSVLALGNTTYDHFCKYGRDLDAALERHGALRLYPRMDCDVDYEVPAKRWLNGVLATLRRELEETVD